MENKEIENQNVQNNNMTPQEQTVPTEQPIQQVEQVHEEQPVQTQHKTKSMFNGEEEVLFTLEEEKEGNALIPILLFVALIGVILILPLISKKIDFKVFEPPAPTQTPGGTTEEDGFYYFGKTSTRAKIGTLEFTNLVKSRENNEYLLSFTLNNVGEKSYDFSKKYYIGMYENKKLVYRALIHSYNGLGALSATTMTLPISKTAYSNADRFKLEELPTASYPEVKTVNVDGEFDVLTCTYNYNTIEYYFKEKELYRIHDEYQESITDNNVYLEHKTKYEKDSNKYKAVENISSIFVETEEDFRMINDLDLSKLNDITMSKLKTYRFFRFKENIKTVSFEMEAQGYTCG